MGIMDHSQKLHGSMIPERRSRKTLRNAHLLDLSCRVAPRRRAPNLVNVRVLGSQKHDQVQTVESKFVVSAILDSCGRACLVWLENSEWRHTMTYQPRHCVAPYAFTHSHIMSMTSARNQIQACIDIWDSAWRGNFEISLVKWSMKSMTAGEEVKRRTEPEKMVRRNL